MVEGTQGELLSRNLRETEIVGVNYWTTSRRNVLWTNRSTGYSMGVAFHSPRWERFGIIPWSPHAITSDGVFILSRTSPPGQSPPATKHIHLTKDGSISLGGVQAIHEGRARYRTNHKGERGAIRVGAGETERVGFSVRFYRDTRDRAIDGFEAGARRAVGVANARGDDGELLDGAGAPQYLNERFRRSGRWTADSHAEITVRNGRGRLSASRPGAGMEIAFRRDFRDPTELRLRIADVADEAAVDVTLRDPARGKEYPLGRFRESVRKPLNFAADENFTSFQNTPSGPGRYRLNVSLVRRKEDGSAEGSLWAELGTVAMAWPTPQPPKKVGPPSDFEMTDIALAFEILPRTPQQAERSYRIQVSPDGDFTSPDTYRLSNEIRHRSRDNATHKLVPEKVYPVGEHHWRTRSVGLLGERSEWGEPGRFTIGNRDHTAKPPRRKISPTNPLFLFARGRNNRKKEFLAFREAMPKAVREHSGADVPMRLANWVEGTDFPVLPKAGGGHVISGAVNLPALERLMRNHPRILGWIAGEAKFPDRVAARYLKLAGKYGRRWGLLGGSGGGGNGYLVPGANKRVYSTLETHSPYFLNMMKSQNPYTPFAGYLNLVGLWLSGRQRHWGAEAEWFQPHKVIKDANIRGIDWMQPLLMGLAHGATVYRLEAFMSHGKRPTGWNPKKLEFGAAWTRAVGPFYVDILEHDLIPTRDEVMENVKVALQPPPRMTVGHSRKTETYPIDLVYGIHGIEDHWRQWMQHETRYYMVPVLPALATEKERSRFERVVNPARFDTADEARKFLNQYYPPEPEDNEAFAVLVGDTGVITNGEGKASDAKPKRFRMRLTKGPVDTIRGSVGYHQYLILKQKDDGLFIHANNHREDRTRFTLRGGAGLAVERVVPADAALEIDRSSDGRNVTVTLRHDHRKGVVRVYVD